MIRSATQRGPVALATLAAGMIVAAGHGQWPEDAASNLAIGDRSGEQVQAKIVRTPDGGSYVGWFDNSTGGYDVYLQRLDAGGHEQWAHNGVLIADRSFSSTQDWDADVDDAGNAYLAFRDTRPGGTQITATRVNADGSQPWGAGGVQLTSTAEFVAAPKIAATSDGNVVVAWSQEGTVHLRKLGADGVAVWGADVVLSGGNGYAASDLDASDAGGAVLAIVDGFFGAHLLAQKLDTNGGLLWGVNPVAVFDGGALQLGNFPQFVPDGSGGAVFGWYGTGPLQCYAQRILADGSEQWTHNGVAGATAPNNRVSPDVDFDPVTEETFLFWTELNAGQSAWGITGQKISSKGNRMWTDAGKTLVPMNGVERTQVRTLAYDGGAYVFFVDKPSPPFGQRILATRVDTNGDFLWSPTIPEACSVVASKSRLAVALSTTGTALLAWSDGRSDANDVYGQNVNPDGSLGPPPGDVTGDGFVGFDDLVTVLADWGPCPGMGDCPADLTGDGSVGFPDLLEVLANWS